MIGLGEYFLIKMGELIFRSIDGRIYIADDFKFSARFPILWPLMKEAG